MLIQKVNVNRVNGYKFVTVPKKEKIVGGEYVVLLSMEEWREINNVRLE